MTRESFAEYPCYDITTGLAELDHRQSVEAARAVKYVNAARSLEQALHFCQNRFYEHLFTSLEAI